MKLVKLFVLCLLICSVSCVEKQQQHVAVAEKFIDSVAGEMNEECGLRMYASGGGFRDHINSFQFRFCSNRKLDLDEARKFYFSVVDKLIAKISSDDEVMAHLGHYPFDVQDLKLSIRFVEGSGYIPLVSQPHIATMFLGDGIVYYFVAEEDRDTTKQIHSESVTRARGILEHQNNLLYTQTAF